MSQRSRQKIFCGKEIEIYLRLLMSFRSKFGLVILSATLALYTIIGGWISTSAQQPKNDPSAQLRIFENVLQHIQNDYVHDPNLKKAGAAAFPTVLIHTLHI